MSLIKTTTIIMQTVDSETGKVVFTSVIPVSDRLLEFTCNNGIKFTRDYTPLKRRKP